MDSIKKLLKVNPVKDDFEKAALQKLREKQWPDGKSRPHIVKTNAGERLALTDEEFDALLKAAAAKAADKTRKVPTQGLSIREHVVFTVGEHAQFFGEVLKVKADGRLWIVCSGLSVGLEGALRRSGETAAAAKPYRVSSAGQSTAGLRPVL